MIWVIGSNGMLGKELCLLLKEAGLDYFGSDKEVDILNPEALKNKADEVSPDWLINCSAYTAVDKAEDDVELAYKINRDGVANLASLARDKRIPIIHISTDYVFDGTSSSPLNEEAPVGPVGIYGKSKLAGEEEIRRICKEHYIIRTAWLYGQYGPNFVYTMTKLMNKLDSLKVINDQFGSPTWTQVLIGLIITIIKSESNNYGTYHLSGEGHCSWYDFASEIYRLGQEKGLILSQCTLNPCTTEEFPTPAKRPAYSLLCKDKVKNIFNYKIPLWHESLQTFLKGIRSEDII
jgi:dTDP-4-dehydrorhamnose reductase